MSNLHTNYTFYTYWRPFLESVGYQMSYNAYYFDLDRYNMIRLDSKKASLKSAIRYNDILHLVAWWREIIDINLWITFDVHFDSLVLYYAELNPSLYRLEYFCPATTELECYKIRRYTILRTEYLRFMSVRKNKLGVHLYYVKYFFNRILYKNAVSDFYRIRYKFFYKICPQISYVIRQAHFHFVLHKLANVLNYSVFLAHLNTVESFDKYPQPFYNSEIVGNVIDLCPVGALTSKPYSFTARPWELTSTESIDILDSLCSNIRIDSRGSELMRVLPRLNHLIN